LHSSKEVGGPNTICPLTGMCANFGQFSIVLLRTTKQEKIVVIMHTIQVTQTVNLHEVQAKTIIEIGCDHLRLNIIILFFIHTLHM
jgi:hypothetical protein